MQPAVPLALIAAPSVAGQVAQIIVTAALGVTVPVPRYPVLRHRHMNAVQEFAQPMAIAMVTGHLEMDVTLPQVILMVAVKLVLSASPHHQTLKYLVLMAPAGALANIIQVG